MFLHCPGCNDTFGAEDIDYAMLAKARVFHFGYPPLMRRMIEEGAHELVALFARAHETGATTVLDMCMPDPDSLSDASIGRASWLRPCRMWMFTCPASRKPCSCWILKRDASSAIARPAPECRSHPRGWRRRPGGCSAGAKDRRIEAGFPGPIPAHCRKRFLEKVRDAACRRSPVPGLTGRSGRPVSVPRSSAPPDPATLPLPFSRCGPPRNEPEECVTLACAVGACNVEAADALGGCVPGGNARPSASGLASRGP